MDVDGTREHLSDLLGPLGGLTMRKMFGGLSLYRDGVIFAIVIDDGLYFKADAETIPAFEAEGCGCFEYTGKTGRTTRMPYWRAPDRLYDEPDEMIAWARAAVGAAHRIGAAREAKARSKPAPRSRPRSKVAPAPE